MGSHFNHEQKLPTHFPYPKYHKRKSLRPIYGSEMQTWLPDWSSTHLIHSTFKLPITADVVVTIWTSSHHSSGATYRCLIHDHFKKHIILRAKLSFLFSKHSSRTRMHSSRMRTNQWRGRVGGGGGQTLPGERSPPLYTTHPCSTPQTYPWTEWHKPVKTSPSPRNGR